MYKTRWWAAAGSPVRVYWFHPRGGRVDWDWDLLLHLAKDKNKHTNKTKGTPKGPPDQPLCSLGSSTCSFMTSQTPSFDVITMATWAMVTGYNCWPWRSDKIFAASLGDTVRKANCFNLLLSFRLTRSPLIRISGRNTHTHFTMGVSAFSYQPCVTPSSCRVFRQSEWILVNINQHVCCRSRS